KPHQRWPVRPRGQRSPPDHPTRAGHRQRHPPESRPLAAGRRPAPVESLNPTRRGSHHSGPSIPPAVVSLSNGDITMNAVTKNETRAVATALEVADPTKNLILVPLSRLLARRS